MPGAEWQRIEPGHGVCFRIPPDAHRGPGTPVDSSAGYFDGEAYRIAYDLGRFPETLDDYADRPGFARRSRRIGERKATEVAFAPEDEDWGWARILQLELEPGRTLTLRVSCTGREACGVADAVFGSVSVD